MNIDIIIGARPNFVKASSVIHAIKEHGEGKINYKIIHTGQHYDRNMSGDMLIDLEIPFPDMNFVLKEKSSIDKISDIMQKYEKQLNNSKPDICMVFGDVLSTVACTAPAKYKGVKIAHVESGLRSFDYRMPEEINRILTDSITDYHYTSLESANKNLLHEGVPQEKIIYVGNTMIDTLIRTREKWEYKNQTWEYYVLTLHRPYLVDNPDLFKMIIQAIAYNLKDKIIYFPVHPRTKQNLFKGFPENIKCVDPMPYLKFMNLLYNCNGIITDSGGITEEASYLGKQCITLRENTERPETIYFGTNNLVGFDKNKIAEHLELMKKNALKTTMDIKYWDGRAGERIVTHLKSLS